MNNQESLKLIIVNQSNIPVKDALVSIVNAPKSFSEIAALTDQNGLVSLPTENILGSYSIVIFNNGQKNTITISVDNFIETITVSIP